MVSPAFSPRAEHTLQSDNGVMEDWDSLAGCSWDTVSAGIERSHCEERKRRGNPGAAWDCFAALAMAAWDSIAGVRLARTTADRILRQLPCHKQVTSQSAAR